MTSSMHRQRSSPATGSALLGCVAVASGFCGPSRLPAPDGAQRPTPQGAGAVAAVARQSAVSAHLRVGEAAASMRREGNLQRSNG
jgi:hypothetical protein